MTIEQENEISIEFNFLFSNRFSRIAEMADKGDDAGYGKGLANLQTDIEKYFINLIKQKEARLIEEIEKLIKDLPNKTFRSRIRKNDCGLVYDEQRKIGVEWAYNNIIISLIKKE